MSLSLLAHTRTPPVEVMDLSQLEADCLRPLWSEETDFWACTLNWDVSSALAVVRRAVNRRSLRGKAARVGSRFRGYGYWLKDGRRAVISGFTLLPGLGTAAVGVPLVEQLIRSIQDESQVERIETQFVSREADWLSRSFRQAGFREHRRAFLRRRLAPERDLLPVRFASGSTAGSHLQPWSSRLLPEVVELMCSAHRGGVDAQTNELYRTTEGCLSLLENILFQRGCGTLVSAASYLSRDTKGGSLAGFVITTQISPGHAHIAQIAVHPHRQGAGMGRRLLEAAVETLATRGFQSVSLMVSFSNVFACQLYESLGFREVLGFPVFSWDRTG